MNMTIIKQQLLAETIPRLQKCKTDGNINEKIELTFISEPLFTIEDERYILFGTIFLNNNEPFRSDCVSWENIKDIGVYKLNEEKKQLIQIYK